MTSVLDVDKTKCEKFSTLKTASSTAELVVENDVIFTALPMPQHVKQVFEVKFLRTNHFMKKSNYEAKFFLYIFSPKGEDGLLAGIKDGKVWIDHSTTDYEQTVDLNEEIVKKGGRMLEAPVTGGLEALKKGQMTVFLAGSYINK